MTRVAILWHMHQPFYQDLLTGEHVLPWVRMHAIKDYWGMVAILREHPSVKVTFNLVPSLLVQLEAFAREEARDRHLELGMKPAELLSADERTFCVGEFFHAHRTRMVDPYPRYRELLALRDHGSDREGLSARALRFSVEDIRDLQVWHKLVWIDPVYFEQDGRVSRLVTKGRRIYRRGQGHTPGRRTGDHATRDTGVRGGRGARAGGAVHVALLPSNPAAPLRLGRVPADPPALGHAASAVPSSRKTLPISSPGPSPSMNGCSDSLRVGSGLQRGRCRTRWCRSCVARGSAGWRQTRRFWRRHAVRRSLATPWDIFDEPEALYRSFRVGGEEQWVGCGFRDHRLSDLIGFSYASWPAERAADDFVGQIVEAGRRYAERTGGEEATIFVILDGENAWESYEGQGRPFLHALYSRLGSHPEIRTVTMSEACAEPTERLPSIFPGSWINGDFYIWMGHADDHRAWSQLVDARRALEGAPASTPPEALARAREELLVAEGSDWFWWYGDDHSSDHDRQFDDLFRRHVRNIYDAIGRPIPAELFRTNITTEPIAPPDNSPECLIQPLVDGEITSYFEWMGAGSTELVAPAGAMHASGTTNDIREAGVWV